MKRALVVDDKEENRAYLAALLRGHGYDVASAKHGAEALTLARQTLPDVVITDLLMPVMDGFTLLRHWKLDERLSGVPFVVYTATYTEPEDEQLAVKLGADAFVLKPVEPDELMARIRSAESGMPLAPVSEPPGSETGLLREYNEALIRKLEQKTLQLEDANRSLQADIASRKLTEAALRESEASFRLLTEAMPQLVWMADADGRNLFTNQRWFEHTGMTSLDSRGDGWLLAFHTDDRERVAAEWGQAVRGRASFSLEARVRDVRGDRDIGGGSRACLVRALPMRDAEARITRWFGTCTDIQELKDTEARLRQTEEQLQHAQKMEAVGRLAAGVAHDFNNLLSVILTYASLVLGDLEPGGPLREDVAQIQLAGERAAALTRQLLSFSRQHAMQRKVVVPGQIATEMQPMLRRLLGEDVDLAFIAPTPFGRVLVDAAHIEQIVMNLAVNARDAMPRGGKLTFEVQNVEIGATAGEKPVVAGPYVKITVTDTGTGMDAATRERIFDPFFTTKELGKGTGLGLSTVFGIVQQSGGYIAVDSALGRGTTFDVYLPRTDRPDDEVVTPAQPPVSLRGSETVLLVEDDDQVRHTCSELLRRSGYEVLDARNGGEALLLSEKTPRDIHLLVTDVVMPHMSGPDLAARLRQTRTTMRVLFVSGYAGSSIAEQAGQGVFEGAFLQKPIVPGKFLRVIREVLAT